MLLCLFFCYLPPSLPTCPAIDAVVTKSSHPGTFMLGIGDAKGSLCLGSTTHAVVSETRVDGAGMGDEVEQDTAALPRNLAAIASG